MSPSQLDLDKQLYHELQNLEYYPSALLVAYNRLLSLFDAAIDKARTSSTSNILTGVPTFSEQALNEFLDTDYSNVCARYKAYLERRKTGSPRELFPDFEYAKYWLRAAAPVKYVDGAWLGGIHRITAGLTHRPYTKSAWQIFSEELGDGDIEKNHASLYRKLLESIDADDIGTGDSEEFILSHYNMNNESQVWTGAITQLSISLFPELFLPEILGFNMCYESLPLYLLITIYELRELNIDPYYFILHVSIDNKHSGHAAIGKNAVLEYMKSLPFEEQNTVWKRVQAGFILASELPNNPAPRSDLDRAVEKLFGEKTMAAHSLHAICSAKIGGQKGKTLSDWLNPSQYPLHSLVFLRALANSRWIVRGKPEKSKLIRELKWGGRMFGAFTINEVAILESWIRELTQYDIRMERTKTYELFTGVATKLPNIELTDKLADIIARPSAPRRQLDHFEPLVTSSLLPVENKDHAILSLLSVSSVPFEYLPSLPAKCTSSYGMMAVKCLRALHGFLPESDVCAGMDEVTSNVPALGVTEIGRIALGSINESVCEFVEYILCLSAHPEKNQAILVGLQYGFIEYVFEACKQLGTASAIELKKLEEIHDRCQSSINAFIEEKKNDTNWLACMTKGQKAVQNLVSQIMY